MKFSPSTPGKAFPVGFRLRDPALLLQALILVVVTVWIYGPSLQGQWLWDDTIDFRDNPVTQSPTGLWSIWFEPGSQVDYYPVKASVQWVQWHLWHNDMLGYHVTNLLLHILNALLVWRLLRRLGLRLAWLGGLIFAVHPVQVESVAWIAELKNTLSLPFFLGSILAYLDYEEYRRERDYILSIGLFLMAMLAKPSMIMFPVVLLLHAWWKRGRIAWSDLRLSAPYFAISLALGIMTLLVGRWYSEAHHTVGNDVSLHGLVPRLVLTGSSILFYFWKSIWPMHLMPMYPQWKIDPPGLMLALAWPLLAAVFLGCWSRRSTWGRHLLFGLGFFIVMLLPFVGLISANYMKFTWVMDHFLYIPILGLIALVVAGLEEIDRRVSPLIRRSGIGIIVLVVALLASESRSYVVAP